MSAVLQDPALRLRPMRAADIENVMIIEESVYAFPWTYGIFHDCLRVGYCCWVLLMDEDIAAYAVLSTGAGESHLLNICVAPANQNQGLGRQLVEHMLDLAKRHGAKTCLLEVRPSNHVAVELYQKMDFVEVGTRPGYYPAHDGREDALILARELTFE